MKACPFEAADGAELVARDDRGGIAGQRRRIGREIAQQSGDERACGAPQRQAHEKGARDPAESTRSCTTIATAPITVPIIRNQPLRSEAPRCGWQTIAAVVPAQNALSSSSQNAT